MHERCCCGCCSLYFGTSAALAFAATEAVVRIFINVELLLLISESAIFNPSYLVINIQKIDDFDVFHGIVLAALGLNAFWFLFSIFAAVGNIYQSHGRLTPWIFLTYLNALFEFGVTIYFGLKFQSSFTEAPELFRDEVPTKTLTYLTLLSIYSGGGLLLFLKFFLANIVERRGKEIDRDFSTLAMYILSNIGRCSYMNDGMHQNLLPEAPPSYGNSCPSYLPPEIFERINDNIESSWSLSFEALKRVSTGQVNPLYDTNDGRRHVLTQEQLADLLSRSEANDCQPLNIEARESSAMPY